MQKGIDAKALTNLTYGLYIIGARSGIKLNAQIANAVMQVTSNPVRVAIALNKLNFTQDCLCDCGAFSVSVLKEETPMTFIGHFGFKSGRELDKFDGIGYDMGEMNVPVVRDWCLSGFDAQICDRLDVGTHIVFIGEVRTAQVWDSGTPLSYAHYHTVKKGKSPKTAPTFVGNVAATS